TSFYELVKRGEIRTVLVAGRRLVPDTEARRLLAEAVWSPMIFSKRNPAAGHSGGARKLVYFINANTANISRSRCDIQVFRASPKNCPSSNRTTGSSRIVRLN